VPALVIDNFTSQQRFVYSEKLPRNVITLRVRKKQTVARVLVWIPARYNIDEHAPVRQPIERRCHSGHDRRREKAWPGRNEKSKPLSQGCKRGGNDPRVLAGSTSWNENTVVSEDIRGLCYLLDVPEIAGSRSFFGAEIPAISARWEKPEYCRSRW
jgi:hypothetical protein